MDNKTNKKLLKTFILILSALLMVVSLCLMEFTNLGSRGISLYNNGYGLFDMHLKGYSPQTVYDVLNQMGTKGIAHYNIFFIIDNIFVISVFYTLFVFSMYISRKSKQRWIGYGMAAATAVKAVTDFIENTLLIIVINNFPAKNDVLIKISSILTTVKFTAFPVFFLLLFLSLIFWLLSKISERHKAS